MTSQNPADLARQFLTALADGDVDAALVAIHDDIAYTNVSLPTVHGKRRFGAVMRKLNSNALGFDVQFLSVSADGPVVLTERLDELRVGPLRIRFWVCGRFEVRDGQITVWRDYFDFLDVTRGLVRGLLTIPVPGLNRSFTGVGRGR